MKLLINNCGGICAIVMQGFVAAMLVVILILAWQEAYPVLRPMSGFATVGHIRVDDMKTGGFGSVFYDRNTVKRHRADWHAQILHLATEGNALDADELGRFTPVCSGSGSAQYTPGLSIPRKVTLRWYIGGDCVQLLKPGTYVLRTTWTLLDPNTGEYAEAYSNEFRVTP